MNMRFRFTSPRLDMILFLLIQSRRATMGRLRA